MGKEGWLCDVPVGPECLTDLLLCFGMTLRRCKFVLLLMMTVFGTFRDLVLSDGEQIPNPPPVGVFLECYLVVRIRTGAVFNT
jgi:hypothetical protein